jgi:hypothetical protein
MSDMKMEKLTSFLPSASIHVAVAVAHIRKSDLDRLEDAPPLADKVT